MAITSIEKESYMLYRGWNPLFESLPKEQLGELFYAICCYQSGNEYEIENPLIKGIFEMVLLQFRKDEEKYITNCETKSQNGKKGADSRWQKKNEEDGKNSKCHSEDGKNSKCHVCHTEEKTQMAKMAIEEEVEDKDKEEVEEKDILPPYSPPKGGKADSSLRSESRENVSVYTPPKTDRTDYQAVLDAFHELCPSLPKVLKLSDSRKKAIKARLNDFGLDEIKRAFALTEQSDFLKGNNANGWQAGFDWLMKPANLTKVLEGNYENKHKAGKPGSMFGEDDYLAKVARGEASIMGEWFGGVAEGG
nr:DUF6291 domain-containing protein [uncultured Oribacterium sp.]